MVKFFKGTGNVSFGRQHKLNAYERTIAITREICLQKRDDFLDKLLRLILLESS